MSTTRGALSRKAVGVLTVAVVGGWLAAAGPFGCGGGGAAGGGAAGRAGAAGGAAAAGRGTAGATADAGADAAADGARDLATDFGEPPTDVAINCPTAAGALAPVAGALLIDDFESGGRLDGRSRLGQGFSVKEQFDATANARFVPVPGVEAKCGAAAPGAAHFRGSAADTGATFAMIFSGASADGGKTPDRYDASATKGVRFRVALGDAQATKLLTVQVNVAGSQWDYTKDVIVAGTAWQDVEVLWSDLQSAAAAPKFSAAGLNQIVLPFIANADVDLYLDDVAFVAP